MSQFTSRVRIVLIFFISTAALVFASGPASETITHQMTNLVIEVGIIIFAAKIGGMLAEKINMPSVLGELGIGILIGPFVLGGLALPGFPEGLIPIHGVGSVPVSPELYGIATIASIILLFGAGLETDFNLFIKYSVPGTIIGLGGVALSFVGGVFTATFLLGVEILSTEALFLGVMSTPASVGMTARILSERRKMDSPEGVSVMAGAVVADVLGIILLAVVISIATARAAASGAVDWGGVVNVAITAVGVWLVFTVLGVVFSRQISRFLKTFESPTVFSVLSLGLALLLAGIFEKAGLAMIVGAYVMGLALSRTDVSYVIHERLNTLQAFFVPVFFTVMGMLVNPRALISRETIVFGLLYTAGALAAKIIGSGIPSLALRFNMLGAARIGVAMVPRGEVALIMAGVGLSQGFVNESLFGVVIMMVLITMVINPPILSALLRLNRKGTRKDIALDERVSTLYTFHSVEMRDFIANKLVETFRAEGFFVSVLNRDHVFYIIEKDAISITLHVEARAIQFKTKPEDMPYIKNVMYETFLDLHETISKLAELQKPTDEMRSEISEAGRMDKLNIRKSLSIGTLVPKLLGTTKEEIINELVDVLAANKLINNIENVRSSVFARENVMSTGLQHGIAIPHAKCEGVEKIVVAIGLKEDGVDFASLDKMPAKIIVLVIAPVNAASAHLQMISNVTSVLMDEENRLELLSRATAEGIYDFFAR